MKAICFDLYLRAFGGKIIYMDLPPLMHASVSSPSTKKAFYLFAIRLERNVVSLF